MPRHSKLASTRVGAALGALGLCCLLGASLEAAEAPAAPGEVIVTAIRTAIHPISADVLDDAIAEAGRVGASLLVVELDTPGGSEPAMRRMMQSLLGSVTPVVVYVEPAGARAASAGFFLLLAADIAAMAPGTNAGASAVVQGGGQDVPGKLGEKAQQDAAAALRALAKRKNRDAALAEEAVFKARSFDATEAQAAGLVDLVAPSLTELLAKLEGRAVTRANGQEVNLRTAGSVIRRLEPTGVQRFLGGLADPNLAYLLLTLGTLGLIVELYNPGAILPGVVGAICLVLAFFALSVLPTHAAGLALLALAALFFIAEIKVTSYGLLSVAGVVSLVLGALLLFDSPVPALRVSGWVIATTALLCVAVVGFLATLAWRSRTNRVVTGREGLVGRRAVVQTALTPAGKVFVHGEWWNAVAEAPVAPGQEVEIVAVAGLTLHVRALSSVEESSV